MHHHYRVYIVSNCIENILLSTVGFDVVLAKTKPLALSSDSVHVYENNQNLQTL